MSANLNIVILTGRLIDNATLFYTKDGKAITKFTIAVNSYQKDKTSFFNCVYFNEKITQYLTKGKLIELSGSLHQDKWIDKANGQKRTAVSIMVNNVFLLPDGKSQENKSTQNPFDYQNENINNVATTFDDVSINNDDDIPF